MKLLVTSSTSPLPFSAFIAGQIDGKLLSPKSLAFIPDLLAMIPFGPISSLILTTLHVLKTFSLFSENQNSKTNITNAFTFSLKLSSRHTPLQTFLLIWSLKILTYTSITLTTFGSNNSLLHAHSFHTLGSSNKLSLSMVSENTSLTSKS